MASTDETAVSTATYKPVDSVQSAVFTLLSTPSTKNKIKNKGILKGDIIVQISGASDGAGCSQVGTVNAIITPDATKTAEKDNAPITKGDQSDPVTINGLQGQVSCDFQMTVEVDNPGQDVAETK